MVSPYPFTAIVGQEPMKLALILAAIDPKLGGVLIFGDRGTGKSTAVRALAALLPPMRAADCAYHCEPTRPAGLCAQCENAKKPKSSLRPVPVVDLPLGATEDRVVGALNLERALSKGEKAFEPGLLAAANRGFLYIDEANLLEDHIVDLLLDVAASGVNVVEREGLSLRHPARFVLIGSGNPEEGELRPQLLDRFGLSVDVKTTADIPSRIEVIKRRDSFERDGEAFHAAWAAEERKLRQKILKARDALDEVATPDAALERVTRLCMALGTDGLRGELTLMRAARALAAFEGRGVVDDAQLRAVAPLALGHRLRRNPMDDAGPGVRVTRAIDEVFGA